MLFGLIFSIILLSYIAFHAIAYFSLVKFFAISSVSLKIAIFLSLVFLAILFFVSVFLSHWKENFLTRELYFFSGVWIGFLINLVIFFALTWLIVFANSYLKFQIDLKMHAIIMIIAAIAVSVYGIWNAFSPAVKKINVQIEGLSEEWKGKKIVQISDLHLGHVYNGKYLWEIIEKINSLDPDLVLITGDFFDGTDGSLDSFIEPLKNISAKEGIFYVTGNHETYLGKEKVLKALLKTKIIALQDRMQTISGLQIIGIDYPERMDSKDLEKIINGISGFDPQKPSILLWHAPTQVENAKNAGISLMLSGHTHKGQLFPFGFITSLVFKGYDYGYKKDGNFSIYTTSGLGTWGPPMRTQKSSEIVEITLQ